MFNDDRMCVGGKFGDYKQTKTFFYLYRLMKNVTLIEYKVIIVLLFCVVYRDNMHVILEEGSQIQIEILKYSVVNRISKKFRF